MKKNNDPDLVVLSREMFDAMENLASIGASECGDELSLKRIMRHARKFNAKLKDERARELKAERIAREAAKVRVKAVFAKYKPGDDIQLVYDQYKDPEKRYSMVRLIGKWGTQHLQVRLKNNLQVHVPASMINLGEIYDHDKHLHNQALETLHEILSGPLGPPGRSVDGALPDR